jgi:hypothetical protein
MMRCYVAPPDRTERGQRFRMARARRTGQTGLARAAMAGEQIVDRAGRRPTRSRMVGAIRRAARGPAIYDFALRAALAKNQRRIEEGIKRDALLTAQASEGPGEVPVSGVETALPTSFADHID